MPSRRIRRIMGNDVEQILTQSRPCASELCARDEESCLRRDCHVRMRIEHEPQQCCAGPRGTDDDRHGWITGSSPLHQPLESLPHQNSPFRWLAGRVLTLWTAPCRSTRRSRRYLLLRCPVATSVVRVVFSPVSSPRTWDQEHGWQKPQVNLRARDVGTAGWNRWSGLMAGRLMPLSFGYWPKRKRNV